MGINIFKILNKSPGNSLIPGRDPGAVTGSGFIKANMHIKGAQREANILNEFKHGNIPEFLRHFVPIDVVRNANTLTYLVMSDYLSIGSNSDYCRMPMNPLTAQAIANQYDCSMPTKTMVDNIWQNSINRLAPKPWGPPYDNSMEDTYRYGIHNNTIQQQLIQRDPTVLTSGHKKDVVLTNKLAPTNANHKVAIYGWIQNNGTPIQGLNTTSHDDRYADYSHGIRLIANDVMINGVAMRLPDVLKHPTLCYMLCDEGPLYFTHY